jgi:AraC family carnitine catabolism transcriptional activator
LRYKKTINPEFELLQRLSTDIARPLDFVFFLMPGFPLYALIPAIESLRIANQNTGQDLFRWKLLGEGPPIVRSSNGMTLSVDGNILDETPPDFVMIFAGNEPTQNLSAAILSWLRGACKSQSFVVGVDTGVFALAEAGLLQDRLVTLHWEALPLFRECYPDIQTTEKLYHADGPIISCAGGIAVLDMILEIIRIRHGDILAQVVANGFVYTRWRSSDDLQRTRGPEDMFPNSANSISSNVLSAILRTMEENLDAPLDPAELAERFHMSRRTLERLFRKKLGDSVAKYYMRLRIDMARDFLFYSDMDVLSVAIAFGFSSQSSFSRSFQKLIGMTPSAFRRMYQKGRISPYRPRARYHLNYQHD